MGLKHARELSATKGTITRLLRTLPSMITVTTGDVQTLLDLNKSIEGSAKQSIVDEITAMDSIESVIANAASIAYYAKKFNINPKVS